MGSVIDLSHPLSRNLISSWDMLDEDSRRLVDSIPGGMLASFNGGMKWDHAVRFTANRQQPVFNRVPTEAGGTDYLEVANDARYNPTICSLEFWYRTPPGLTVSGNPWIWGRDMATTRHGWCFTFGTGPLISLKSNGLTGANHTDAAYIDGNWHHVVGQINGTTRMELYTDGVFRSSNAPASFDFTGTTVIRWGKSPDPLWAQLASGVQFGPCRYRTNIMLRADDVKWLYEEPYAMFKGPQVSQRYWYFRTALVPSRRRQSVIG